MTLLSKRLKVQNVPREEHVIKTDNILAHLVSVTNIGFQKMLPNVNVDKREVLIPESQSNKMLKIKSKSNKDPRNMLALLFSLVVKHIYLFSISL